MMYSIRCIIYMYIPYTLYIKKPIKSLDLSSLVYRAKRIVLPQTG